MSTRYDNQTMMDFTAAINKVPRQWNILDDMNLAETVGVSTETASVDVIQERTGIIKDTRRDGPRNFVGAEKTITKNLTIPLFTLDGALRPTDYQNLRKFGTENDLETQADMIDKISRRIMRYHGALREKALVESVMGSAFVPANTTEQYDYYTVFEQTRKEVAFDFANNPDPMEKAEEVWSHIIENSQDGSTTYEVLALCSPEFMNDLLKNDTYRQAYTYYASQTNVLRDRQGGNGYVREFVFGNIRYMEYAASFNGERFMPAGEAYFFPVGIEDMFKVYHAPANHLDYTNTEGQEAYLWVHRDPKGRKVEVESETAMLAVNHRPELVVRAVSGATP